MEKQCGLRSLLEWKYVDHYSKIVEKGQFSYVLNSFQSFSKEDTVISFKRQYHNSGLVNGNTEYHINMI